jgi:hypothetical protein
MQQQQQQQQHPKSLLVDKDQCSIIIRNLSQWTRISVFTARRGALQERMPHLAKVDHGF